MTELPKQYDPKSAQERWLKFWEDSQAEKKASRAVLREGPFCIHGLILGRGGTMILPSLSEDSSCEELSVAASCSGC